MWHRRLLVGCVAAAVLAAPAACIGDLTGGEVGGDAGAPPPIEAGSDAAPPADGFTLALGPAHVTADPGDPPTPVTITVRRAPGFRERIGFQITGGVVGASASTPPDVEGATDTTTFTVGVAAGSAATGESEFVVRGTSLGGKTTTIPLGIRVGSVLVPDPSGMLTLPPYARAIDVAAWGAGGAGGAGGFNRLGVPGGAGGFASGRFDVVGGAVLRVVSGAGGGTKDCGGGGGGYSAVLTGDQPLVVAGGGGGGGAQTGGVAGAGGAGGGAKGFAGGGCGAGQGQGNGGTESAGGGATPCGSAKNVGKAGSSLVGGDAQSPSPSAQRAAPGGGAGSGNSGSGCGGGGGGGAFGGGGGGFDAQSGGGGGGGSSAVATAATSPKLVAGSGASPFQTHPDYVAGVAVGGGGGDNLTYFAGAGGPGRVVVRLAKP